MSRVAGDGAAIAGGDCGAVQVVLAAIDLLEPPVTPVVVVDDVLPANWVSVTTMTLAPSVT